MILILVTNHIIITLFYCFYYFVINEFLLSYMMVFIYILRRNISWMLIVILKT